MKAIRLFIPRFFLSDQQENRPQKLYFLVVKRIKIVILWKNYNRSVTV